MKKIYLKEEEPRKQLYRIILKEFSKQLYEQALADIDKETRFWKKYRYLIQNKENKYLIDMIITLLNLVKNVRKA
tara:strand:+ start:338 stop:562 length:225 start_codon:yes stop_codon:yes gene_type:complete